MAAFEKDILELESQFPAASGTAFAEACNRVLASGQSTLVSEQGVIYRLFPDGRRVEVKQIEPPTHVDIGSRFTLSE